MTPSHLFCARLHFSDAFWVFLTTRGTTIGFPALNLVQINIPHPEQMVYLRWLSKQITQDEPRFHTAFPITFETPPRSLSSSSVSADQRQIRRFDVFLYCALPVQSVDQLIWTQMSENCKWNEQLKHPMWKHQSTGSRWTIGQSPLTYLVSMTELFGS